LPVALEALLRHARHVVAVMRSDFPWLICALVTIATVQFLVSKSWSRVRGTFTHRSSLLDYRYFFVNHAVRGLFLIPILVTGVTLGKLGSDLLSQWLGPGPGWSPQWLALGAFGFLNWVLGDTGQFISHYTQHKIPFLWEFHKVHHAAEALNPATAFRTHPVEFAWDTLCEAPLQGMGLTLFFYLYGDSVSLTSVFALLSFPNFAVSILRHSEVWVSFGPRLEHIFNSPAQHQIHHSKAERHLDKNFAQYFAFLDWIAGTLYIPQGKEQLDYGLYEGHDPELDSVRGCLWVPVKRALRRLTEANPRTALLDCSDCDARALQENR
jgi:sterol desaturase/sphingolipid hydroxylase (fatty acid hydroxylase superfamily)